MFNLKQQKLFYINYNLDELFLLHCDVVIFIEQILYSNFEAKSDESETTMTIQNMKIRNLIIYLISP